MWLGDSGASVKVKNDANIVGNFEALKSSFCDLTINAKSIILSGTRTKNIIIKKNFNERFLKEEQILKLENNTL